MVDHRIVSLVLLSCGLVLGVAWMMGRWHQPFVLLVAMLLFVNGALLFPKTYQVAQRIRPFIGKDVRAVSWGSELPDHSGTVLRLHRTLAFGAGLHLYFAPFPRRNLIHMKIAQPRNVEISEVGLEVGDAKYVQWQGKKIKRIVGRKALVLRIVPESGNL